MNDSKMNYPSPGKSVRIPIKETNLEGEKLYLRTSKVLETAYTLEERRALKGKS